ncbi:hypothetical protein [Streptomyces sp. NPDC088760]|uniref:hypothetical protein n=1 Tax=Streptomyces sp. NPDC088760 TaxID=3365890 RepID=UPI0037F5E224
MEEHGAHTGPAAQTPRSRLYDYADVAMPEHQPETTGDPDHRRREFAVLLGEFRRTAVLVPVDGDGVPLSGDFGGVRWIYAFSNEQSLARFALARGEGAREWAYQRWLGARLLDAVVPAVGVPCGVALDCADGEDGAVFPPVRGIVPDAVAVDVESGTGDER